MVCHNLRNCNFSVAFFKLNFSGCCIYEKPKLFGESSSEEEDNDDGCGQNCRGHKKKCYKSHAHQHKDDGMNRDCCFVYLKFQIKVLHRIWE